MAKDVRRMNKLITLSAAAAILLTGCTSLSHQERITIRNLEAEGISVDKPAGNWQKPAKAGAAGALNLLPGVGNFYLAAGNAGDSDQYLYGFLNLLTWPISILWGIPEAAIDAGAINQRELVYFYTYDEAGQLALAQRGFKLTATGRLEKVK